MVVESQFFNRMKRLVTIANGMIGRPLSRASMMAPRPATRARFLTLILLFMTAMLGAVLSDNLISLFVFWELTSLSSFLLIGFWFKKPTAVFANMKAFLVNRVGDFGFLLGIFGLFALFGAVEFDQIFAASTAVFEGGEEAALFAGDLLRMYLRYAESRGWKTEVLSATHSDLGGYKDVHVAVRGSAAAPVDGVYARLKFEGGVHRVQRVPVTESQGRIQTSAAGVLVYPEPEEVESVNIDDKDIRVDVYRSSGKGGQGVNTTDSAVRITHLPTGLIVTCQKERSQIQNKARALQVLQARLDQMEREAREAEAGEQRASQVRTMDRSERIRTYNWPENRITDHRIGYKANNLDSVLNGDMNDLIKALQDQERAERLEAEG